MSVQWLGFLGAAAVGIALYLVVVGLSGRRAGVVALRQVIDGVTTTPDVYQRSLERSLLGRLAGPVGQRLGALGRRITPGSRTQAVRRRLDHAGSALPVEAYYAVKTAGLALGILLGVGLVVVLSPRALTAVLLLAGTAAGGYLSPDLWLLHRRQQRAQRVERALPEALDLLALTVEAGLGLEQGIAEVCGELGQLSSGAELGAELDRMLKEQQLGRSRADALQAMAGRTSSEDLQALTAALLQAERLGTPIAATLQVQARELRRRRRALARERAGRAPVKLLFPLIFGIFPAMFVVIIGPGALTIIDSLLQR